LVFTGQGSSWQSSPDVHDILTATTDSGGHPTSWTYWRADTRETESYNAAGQLTQIADSEGFKTNLNYSTPSTPASIAPAPGYLISVTDPLGRMLTFTYLRPPNYASQLGLLSTMTDPSGQVYQYAYNNDASGNSLGTLASVTYPSVTTPLPSRTYVYAESIHMNGGTNKNLLTGITDENGNRANTFDYDANGFAIATQHAGGAYKFSLAYDYSQSAIGIDANTTVTDPLNNSIHYTFITQNNRVLAASQSAPAVGFPNVSGRSYDAYNNQTATVDFNNVSTCFSYASPANGLETARTEGVTGTCASPTGSQRTIQTDWNVALRKPTESRTCNGSNCTAVNALETKADWVYNTRGQVIARCDTDPADTSGYTCSSTVSPPAGAKVRRRTYTYCDQITSACPVIGLLLSTDGARTDVQDVTTYAYYSDTVTTGCATLGGACHNPGDLQSVTNALGQTTTYVAYDKTGRVTRLQDPNGIYTDITYHPRGWVYQRTVRANSNGTPNSTFDATTTFAYDNVGNVTRTTQPDGTYLSYAYDSANRLIDVSDSAASGGNHIHYTPDAVGNRTDEKTTDSQSTVWREMSRSYNQLNHLTALLNHNATVQSYTYPPEAPTAYPDGYDGNGNGVYSIDGTANHVGTEQQYDPLNRLIKVLQDHVGTGVTRDTTTRYAYDTRDNLRSVTDPDGLVTNFMYDGLNNLTDLSSPDTAHTGYTYDSAGNRKTQTDARGVTSNYSYDALNRLIGVSFPTATLNITYAYDQAASGCYNVGRLTKITDSSGSTIYCYDLRGNVITKTQATTVVSGAMACSPFGCGVGSSPVTYSGSVSLVTRYTYTLANRLATTTYPSGAVVTYVPDANGRINRVNYQSSAGASTTTLLSGLTYYPFGPAHVFTFGNGRALTKTYDADYSIKSIVSSGTGGTTIDAKVDVLGNLSSTSNTIGATTPTQQYLYDPLYRLTTVQNGSGTALESFTYGLTGDRLNETIGQTSQTYSYTPGTHHLASVGSVARSYDANGNASTLAGQPATYDDRNRLLGLQLTGGTIALGSPGVLYNYNGRGERVLKEVATGSGGGAMAANSHPAGATTSSDWNETPTVYVFNETGQVIGEYVFTISQNGLIAGTSRAEYVYVNGVPVGFTNSGGIGSASIYYVETDQLGSPRQVIKPGATSATDIVVWKWDYFASNSAFGENAPSVQTTTFNLRFPGQYFDAETGLNYNYFRDYEPSTGRYVESDPIGLNAGLTTYAYVRLQPGRYKDKYGLLYTDSGSGMETQLLFSQMKIQRLLDQECNCSDAGCFACELKPELATALQTTYVDFRFVEYDTSDGDVIPFCGITSSDLTNIGLTYGAFHGYPFGQAGTMQCNKCPTAIVFHELLHAVGLNHVGQGGQLGPYDPVWRQDEKCASKLCKGVPLPFLEFDHPTSYPYRE